MSFIFIFLNNSLNTNPSGYPVSAGGGPLRKFPANHHMYGHSSMPMQITNNSIAARHSGTLSTSSIGGSSTRLDCTPTFIEVGAGSYQEGMPVLRGPGSGGSVRSFGSGGGGGGHSSHQPVSGSNDLLGENLIETLADAMNELTATNSSVSVKYANKSANQQKSTLNAKSTSQSISIAASKLQPSTSAHTNNLLLMNATHLGGQATNNNNTAESTSSVGSNSSGILAVGSYFLINPTLANNPPTVNTSLSSASSSSSSASSTSSSGSGGGSNNSNDDDSIASSASSSGLGPVNLRKLHTHHQHGHQQPQLSSTHDLFSFNPVADALSLSQRSGSSNASGVINTGMACLNVNASAAAVNGVVNHASSLDNIQFQEDLLQ